MHALASSPCSLRRFHWSMGSMHIRPSFSDREIQAREKERLQGHTSQTPPGEARRGDPRVPESGAKAAFPSFQRRDG